MGTLFAWFFLFCVFFIVTYKAWPLKQVSHTLYMFKSLQALGFGALVALILWMFIFPFVLNLCFERLIQHVYMAKGVTLPSVSFFKTACSGGYILLKTLHWRCFWIVVAAVMIFVCAPVSLLVLQMGIAHTALLDGCDLSLGVKGMGAGQKLMLIRKHRMGIAAGGVIAGLVSCLLMPTILVWLFWIPGIYVGAALWVHEWDE